MTDRTPQLQRRPPLDRTKRDWWKSAVIYQIYPKSFQDTNGDGIGDLPGILQHLDYLQALGIDAIWLCPIFDSPQEDNGYDIADYQAVSPLFGTMEDLERLIQEADARGIGILLDLVLNHTSSQHRWFQEARKSRDNPYHSYYIWRDGTPDTPPNDMHATFGGSMWTWEPQVQQWYFHQFAAAQPDLNWENPAVRQELYSMIRFWVRKGVSGFRLDVIDQIGKDPDRHITNNGPRLHEFLRELSVQAFSQEGLVTIGEAWGADPARARLYSAQDGSELSMVFQFQHLCLDSAQEKWDVIPLRLTALKQCLERWQMELHGTGWNSLFWDNHDLPRIVSRWGDPGPFRIPSAKMLAILLYGMEGTPFLYQGEEIGMTNCPFTLDQYRDLESLNFYQERIAAGYPKDAVLASLRAVSRDNARTPMQWTAAADNAGFTTGTPWLTVNPNFKEINVQAALQDPNSVFYCYQALIALRKQYPIYREGDFRLLERDSESLFAYLRTSPHEVLLTVCNFTSAPVSWSLSAALSPELPDQPAVSLPRGSLLVSSYPDTNPFCSQLRPYEAYQMRWEVSPNAL